MELLSRTTLESISTPGDSSFRARAAINVVDFPRGSPRARNDESGCRSLHLTPIIIKYGFKEIRCRALTMFRVSIILVLSFQMLVPTGAIARLLLARTEAAASEKSAGVICPCTNNVGCNCCGSADAAPDAKESSTSTFPTTEAPSKNNQSSAPELRCKCHGPDSLNGEVDFFSHLRHCLLNKFDPPQVDQLLILAESWPNPFLAIELHPPRIVA
jgi:hypothetical protein